MREESKLPTEAAFVWAYRAVEHLGQVETAKQLFQHRAEVGLPPQEYVFVKVSEPSMLDVPHACVEVLHGDVDVLLPPG